MITNEAKAVCAEREVQYRRRVYGNMVRKGQMKAASAEYQIMVMQAIAEDYRRLAQADKEEERLL